MPEIIRPGRTGFLVDDVDGAVEAVGRVDSLSRRHCRDDVEERFTAARMVADYAELFARMSASAQQPLDEQRHVDEGEPDRRVAGPVGQQQLVAVPQRAAGVDDVGDVALALVLVGRQQRLAQLADHAWSDRPGRAAAAPMAYSRIGPTPWVSDEPAGVGLDGRAAVADLEQLPRTARRLQRAGVVPPDAVVGRREVYVLAVPARAGRRTGRRPAAGTGPCPCSARPARAAVRCGSDGSRRSGSAAARSRSRRTRCRSRSRYGAVVLDEADEAGVLHAVRLARTLRPQHAFGEGGLRRELDLVTARGDAPRQVGKEIMMNLEKFLTC